MGVRDMTLEVIGSGFGRTGTKSLKEAIEMTGFGPCHHMHEIFEHPEQVAYWQALAAGQGGRLERRLFRLPLAG